MRLCAARLRWGTPSAEQIADSLDLIGVGACGLLFAVQRREVPGIRKPAPTAGAVKPPSIGLPDLDALLAPVHVALKQRVDRPRIKGCVAVSDRAHLNLSISSLLGAHRRGRGRAAERSSLPAAPPSRRWPV